MMTSSLGTGAIDILFLFEHGGVSGFKTYFRFRSLLPNKQKITCITYHAVPIGSPNQLALIDVKHTAKLWHIPYIVKVIAY